MLQILKKLWRIASNIALFVLAFKFLEWYVKGHFGKYFIFFWLNTVISILMVIGHQKKVEEEYDHRTGSEIWEQTH
jgi:hypothetical protein